MLQEFNWYFRTGCNDFEIFEILLDRVVDIASKTFAFDLLYGVWKSHDGKRLSCLSRSKVFPSVFPGAERANDEDIRISFCGLTKHGQRCFPVLWILSFVKPIDQHRKATSAPFPAASSAASNLSKLATGAPLTIKR